MSFDKKDRNKKKEKNKYGEGFSSRERRLNSPVPKKKKDWKKYLDLIDNDE